MAARSCEREGHVVVAVTDGDEAVARLADEAFDVVLLDLQMPRVDGLAAAAQIRARGDQTLLVALSADGRPPDMLRYRSVGVDATISKPVNASELLDAIEVVLAEGGRAVESLQAVQDDGVPPGRPPSYAPPA